VRDVPARLGRLAAHGGEDPRAQSDRTDLNTYAHVLADVERAAVDAAATRLFG
jgi:hypothetical protein